MSEESKLVIEVWEVMRDVLPPARREDAALRLLKVFEENGFKIDEIEGEDSILDEALHLLRDEEDEDEDVDPHY
jgi:hypothetical protein